MKNPFRHPALDQLNKKVTAAAQTGLAQSKQMAEIARLRLANRTEEESMKKAFMELGKLYYAEHGNAPDGIYVALCSRISQCNDTIQANLEQIAQLKRVDTVTEADFADDIQPEFQPEPSIAPEDDEAPVEPVLTPDDRDAVQPEPIPDEE